MKYAGYYKNVLIIGEDKQRFDIHIVDVDKLRELEIDYGYSNNQTNINDGMFYKCMREIKRYVFGYAKSKQLLLKEVYKMGFDTDDETTALAWCFYAMAIDDYNSNFAEVQKKHINRARLKKSRVKRQQELRKRVDKAVVELNGRGFNFNKINWHSSHNLDRVEQRYNSIKVSQANQFGFKQVFNGGKLYINDKKQLLVQQGGFLFPLYDDDYITKGENKND